MKQRSPCRWPYLRRLRLKRGMTVRQLADTTGLHWVYLHQLEAGVRGASDVVLLKLADALAADAAELDRTRPTVPPRSRTPKKPASGAGAA
jgi:transcriptional regulator with XRE-family HTH domain